MCTTDFTTLYNARLLLLRLPCITITTRINALYLIGFFFVLRSFIWDIFGAFNSGHLRFSPIFGFRKNNFKIVCSYLKWQSAYGSINIFRIFGFYENDLFKLQNWSPADIFLYFVLFGVSESRYSNLWYISSLTISLILTVVSISFFFWMLSRFYIAAQGVRMIYFKRLTISLRYCSFYLPF